MLSASATSAMGHISVRRLRGRTRYRCHGLQARVPAKALQLRIKGGAPRRRRGPRRHRCQLTKRERKLGHHGGRRLVRAIRPSHDRRMRSGHPVAMQEARSRSNLERPKSTCGFDLPGRAIARGGVRGGSAGHAGRPAGYRDLYRDTVRLADRFGAIRDLLTSWLAAIEAGARSQTAPIRRRLGRAEFALRAETEAPSCSANFRS